MNFDLNDTLKDLYGMETGKRAKYSTEEIDAARKRQKKCGGTFMENLEIIHEGKSEKAFYAQQSRIEQEISYFYKIVDKIGCRSIDVTNRAVEETAHKIIDMLENEKK